MYFKFQEDLYKVTARKLSVNIDCSRNKLIKEKSLIDFSSFNYKVSCLEDFHIEKLTEENIDEYIIEEFKQRWERESVTIIPNDNLDVSLDISAQELLDNMKVWNRLKIKKITYLIMHIESNLSTSEYKDLGEFLSKK